MAISKFIQEICDDIQVKSGLKINREQRTQPRMEWIAEGQLSKMNPIHLRTAEQTKNGEILRLKQFNPSSLVKGRDKIHCRAPRCSAMIERLPSRDMRGNVKQDLFLCDEHRKTVTNLVYERCAKENVTVDPAKFEKKDFDGYTVLISELEKAFTYLHNKWFMQSVTDSLLAEVFLNTRNFLMITNALLNPDPDNTVTVLSSYLQIFQSFLSFLNDPHLLQSMATALKEIMAMLLGFFGIIYHWVVTNKPKPGTQIGAGLGLIAGFAFGYPLAPALLVTSLFVGVISGSLIGSGGYDWYREEQQIRMQQEAIQNNNRLMSQQFGRQHEPHDLLSAPANASGDLSLRALSEL